MGIKRREQVVNGLNSALFNALSLCLLFSYLLLVFSVLLFWSH